MKILAAFFWFVVAVSEASAHSGSTLFYKSPELQLLPAGVTTEGPALRFLPAGDTRFLVIPSEDWQPIVEPAPWLQELSKTRTDVRRWTDPENGVVYLVQYEYSTMFATVPATMNGQPHYGAEITVYRVEGEVLVQLGASFGGAYTVKGCFEDDPKSLVARALKDLAQ